ncbi:hypothetical protein CR513_30932, partial [Mucuna pruriens]
MDKRLVSISDSIALESAFSRDRVGFISVKTKSGNTHHFDIEGSMASRGRNGISTTDNQRFEGHIDGCVVPSQAILSPQENMSDITVRSGMELPQQQSLKVQYGFSRNSNSKNSTTVMGFADSSSVANSMLAGVDSTKMTKIGDCVPTVFDMADVVKIPKFYDWCY